MRCTFCLMVAAALWGASCVQAHSAGSGANSTLEAASLEVLYEVETAQPRTSFRLHLTSDGSAELGIYAALDGTESDTLGEFAMPLSAETRAEIDARVRDGKLLLRHESTEADAQGSGRLQLFSGGTTAELALGGYDPAVSALRQLLDRVVREVATHPSRALRIAVDPKGEGGSPAIVLKQVGTKPLSALFFDPADARFQLRARLTSGSAEVTLSAEDVAAYAKQGRLPRGVSEVAAGTSIVLPIKVDATLRPTGPWRANVTLWLPGQGASRRAIVLVSP